MKRLTPELIAHSRFVFSDTALKTQELDFNLSRRSGVCINKVLSQIEVDQVVAGFNAIQELDLDPDNVDVWQGGVGADAVEYDSSRLLIHHFASISTANGQGPTKSDVLLAWSDYPLELRPLSITNMRHHADLVTGAPTGALVQLSIYYYIVELTLEELGIVNASRR